MHTYNTTMSSSQTHSMSYNCECGKHFTGEYKKCKMLIKLHHKLCKFKMHPEEAPVIINTCLSHPKSADGIQKTFSLTSLGGNFLPR